MLNCIINWSLSCIFNYLVMYYECFQCRPVCFRAGFRRLNEFTSSDELWFVEPANKKKYYPYIICILPSFRSAKLMNIAGDNGNEIRMVDRQIPRQWIINRFFTKYASMRFVLLYKYLAVHGRCWTTLGNVLDHNYMPCMIPQHVYHLDLLYRNPI